MFVIVQLVFESNFKTLFLTFPICKHQPVIFYSNNQSSQLLRVTHLDYYAQYILIQSNIVNE